MDMEIISFFNPKGGVGKSSYTALYASYLAYACGKRVLVIDYEYPNFKQQLLRDGDLDQLDIPGSPLSRYFEKNGLGRDFYDIECRGMSLHRQTDEFVSGELYYVTKLQEMGYDVVLIDFPGGYSDDCLAKVLIDYRVFTKFIVPVVPSWSGYAASLGFTEVLEKAGAKTAIFWTDVVRGSRTEEEMMNDCDGYYRKVFGEDRRILRIPHYQKLRGDSSRNLFVMSSVCWPQRYVSLYAGEIMELFKFIDRL